MIWLCFLQRNELVRPNICTFFLEQAGKFGLGFDDRKKFANQPNDRITIESGLVLNIYIYSIQYNAFQLRTKLGPLSDRYNVKKFASSRKALEKAQQALIFSTC